MTTLTPQIKKSAKTDRERQVLLGLVDYYIQTGKPVGSNTLKDVGFDTLSSATIRNYFAHLEEEGYLIQQHTSGGRIPTPKAFKLYASEHAASINGDNKQKFLNKEDTRAITSFLQEAAEELASLSNTAVFLSAPRFEQDFIVGIKLVVIDASRCLCILITDFGEVRTEMLYVEHKIGAIAAKRLEEYFNWRLNGHNKPKNLSSTEEELAHKLYNELLVRYIIGYSPFNEEEIYRTGFSSLLTYPEFQDPATLAHSLALFENTHGMKLLLKECSKFDRLKFWIGDDLTKYSAQSNPECAVIAIPYYVNNQPVGSVGLFGPLRLPYPSLFALIDQFSKHISKLLTNNLYKFKITLRQPKAELLSTNASSQTLLAHNARPLLEDQRTKPKVSLPQQHHQPQHRRS